MKLRRLKGRYSIYKFGPDAEVPESVYRSSFYSISKTDEELSIVAEEGLKIPNAKQESAWSVIKVEGPLDFSLTGVLASIANPLAEDKISIFAISTFDTDYILVKVENLDNAVKSLESKGFQFTEIN